AYLQSFFSFLIEEEALTRSPMATQKPPMARPDQIQPFTPEQQAALIEAARKSQNRRRDETVTLFLFDTGARASQACALRVWDLDLQNQRCTVLGKGNKYRTLCFGRATTKALWQYLKEEPREKDAPLFLADRGVRAAQALTRSGLLQLVERIGKAA